jgi:maleylpyruvate isomerase
MSMFICLSCRLRRYPVAPAAPHRHRVTTPPPPSDHDSSASTVCAAARPWKGINGYVRQVTHDPLALLDEVDRATARLLATAEAVEPDPAVPSGLPGWTRGHVLTHVARNADSLVNLLTWARTGEVIPQYPSREHRDAGIAAGAGRPWAALVDDVRTSAAGFARAARELTAEHWTAPVSGRPAAIIPWRRLREVEVHHVDLGAPAYTPERWPEPFVQHLLHELAGGLDGVALTVRPDGSGHPLAIGAGGAPEVRGPAYALAAWLAGRSPGTGLTVEPPGPLPTLPEWM